jgi:parvulin-like peptidyl-prolyl isomerase
VLACALALGAAACGGGGDDEKTSADVPADAIALVGDQPVPKAEFTSLIDRAEDSYKAQKQAFPKVGSPEYQDLKTRAVQFLVQRYEYREEADSLGLSVTDDEITKRLDQIKKQSYGGSEEKFQADLKKLGLTEEEAREEIEDRIIQEKIYKKVTGNLSVSDEEITQFYETNQAQFTQPRKVRHILVKQKALADKLYTQLKNGASFAALAKKYSQDTGSAKKGGELTIQKGQTVAPFDKVAFELDKGEISKPVKTQFGWHIIQALAPVKTTPLDDVKNTIKQQLLTQKQKSAMDTWLKELQRKYSSSVVYAVGYQPTQQASSQ